MADQETASAILEFLLRKPIADDLLNSIFLALPVSPPLPPRLLKTLLLRRLAAPVSSQTLTSLELIEQLDRDQTLTLAPTPIPLKPPSPSLQLAYAAVAVDLTVRFLRDDDSGGGDLGDFFDAVNRIWNCRVGDLEASEARGLVSERLREERRLMEAAAVDEDARGALARRETGREAAEAVVEYLKEAVEEMGPTALEMAAAEVVRVNGVEIGGRDDATMSLGQNEASNGGECSTSGLNHLPDPKVIQEKNQMRAGDEKDHNVIDEPPSEKLTVANGVCNVETQDVSNSERIEENQSLIDRGQAPCVDKVAKDTHTVNNGSDNVPVHATVMNPNHIDQNPTEMEIGEENQNGIGGNAKVSSCDKGKAAINTEGTSKLIGKKRAASILDRNPTARTYKWHDDSIESSPEMSPNPQKKPPVPHSNSRRFETKIPWNREFAGRRKKKWWSPDEEDTLRKAVEKYGAGNWALIKEAYPAIFEERTSIDLKDKWRNMTK